MTRSLACRLHLRLLVMVMSGVILVPKVIHAYNISRNNNLAVYWGQDGGSNQQEIGAYCQDDTIDNIVIAFVDDFGFTSGNINLNLANTCTFNTASAEKKRQTGDCSFLSSQIKQCQDNGKIVTISLGGALSVVGFSTDSQARTFADKIWNMFLDGPGDPTQPRPFGDAVLDGVDLDIESGKPGGYAAFVNRLRELEKKGTNRLYITAAPQCVFQDAHIGEALNEALFDAVYVQFYNNHCGLNYPASFNFEIWDEWARRGSANPQIKVYIGALAAEVGGSGYVGSNTLADYIKYAQITWRSFGGVMLWEASLAAANNNFHEAVKTSLLRGGTASDPPSANGTASTSLYTPGAAPTSLSAHGATSTSLSAPCTTSTSLFSGVAAVDPLSTNSPAPASTSPYADRAKWYHRSHFRRATKYGH